jgi:rhamnogalacturonyl hydrolase YesR
MITRRYFFAKSLTLTATLPFISNKNIFEILDIYKVDDFKRFAIKPKDILNNQLPLANEFRMPFGWDYFTLNTSSEGLILNCDELPENFNGLAYLRMHIAIDTKGKDEVEITLAKSGKKIGHLSIWYATGLQIFDTKLDCDLQSIKNEGIRLTMPKGKKPIYFLATANDRGAHILLSTKNEFEREKAWLDIMCSTWSLQPFDWLEGTLLDGMHEYYLRKKHKPVLKTINNHLDRYLVDDKNLFYVDLSSRPKDNIFNNLERGINFATIAKYRPNHPSVNLFIDFCKSRFDENNKFKPDHLTTEGNYTLAYPLAVLANKKNMPELYEMALIETEERINLLTGPDYVYRAGSKTKGNPEINRNWSRGFVWFLLGLIRTIEVLKYSQFKDDERLKKLEETYKYYANLALKHQQVDYSWKSYLDIEDTEFESSGTAGIGAALAHGARLGYLPNFSKNDLRNIYSRLLKTITPDGFMNGVSQHNAGSMELMQKGKYRVISQYSLGFMAHIKAHL